MRNAQNTKKCAAPGTDHLSSLRWAKTSTTWVLIASPSRWVTFSTRSGAGWPLVMSRNRNNTRRPATGSATASMTSPTISTHRSTASAPSRPTSPTSGSLRAARRARPRLRRILLSGNFAGRAGPARPVVRTEPEFLACRPTSRRGFFTVARQRGHTQAARRDRRFCSPSDTRGSRPAEIRKRCDDRHV